MPSVKDIQYATPPQPRQLRLDSICACNAACPSCHRWLSQKKRHSKMPLELIADLLVDISRWNIPLTEIVPINYGEFFMREDWYSILSMINTRSPATRIVIPTNGSLLTAEVVNRVCRIPSVRVVNISVNAYFDETYQNFMGFPPETIANIRKMAALFKILRPDITLWASMVNSPEYSSDLERDYFIRYWGSVGVQPQILNAASAGRTGQHILIKRQIPCRSIFSDFVIGYDGKLSSCCFDAAFSIDLGNIKNFPDIKSAWQSDEFIEFRQLHNSGRRQEIPLCKACTFE